MRGWKDVGIPRDHQRRRLDAGDVLGEVEILLHCLADLAQQPWPVLRPRRDAAVELIHRSRFHRLRRSRVHLALLSKNVRIESIPPEWSRDDHEPVHDLGVTDRRLQRDAAP